MHETAQAIYEYIVKFQADNGASPTLREIAGALGKAVNTVRYHIDRDERLTRKGHRWIKSKHTTLANEGSFKMSKMFYQIEWGNGNTDVFADEGDALENYSQDNEQWILDHVKNGGFFTDKPDENAEWSEAAKAKRNAALAVRQK